jgi:hypothetical protein
VWLAGEVVVAVVARHHPGVQVEEQEQWHRYRCPAVHICVPFSSVADPNPDSGPDPHGFGPPGSGSGSISPKYGSYH